MANDAFLLLAVLAAATATVSAYGGRGAALPARRSRFLLSHPPLPTYGCSTKSGEACLAPGTACCGGQCVDTAASAEHCGGCNKACRHGRRCCGGRCVDLLSDKKNCGDCSNQCQMKCHSGFWSKYSTVLLPPSIKVCLNFI
ncbi:hypothetical protein ACQ4PT_009255 [Festuca glaucescens]